MNFPLDNLTRRQFLTRAAGLLTGAVSYQPFMALSQPAADANMSPDDTALDEILQRIRTAHDLPALVGAVIRRGHTVAQGAVGVRKYGSAVPVTVKDQFHLGSCTKAMTATLVGMLVEQGRIDWQTTLAAALPNLAPTMHPQFKTVTVEMLLAQRGGFAGESWPPRKSADDMFQLPGSLRAQRRAYVEMMTQVAPSYAPGTKFVYTNAGYVTLGAIIEQVTDTAWEACMTQKLFAPLGMGSAGFGAMGTPDKLDQPWQHIMDGTTHHPIPPGPRSDNPPVIGPAGTVHCAIGDWAKFVAMQVQEGQGKPALLRPDTWRKLHTPPFGGDYMAGWITTQRAWGGTVLTHSGSNTMSFAVVWMAPAKNFAVLAMTNQGGDIAAQACDEVCAAMIQQYL